MKNREFWNKASNYSIIICSVFLITKLIFRKYLDDTVFNIILVLGGAGLFIFLLSELMKQLIKNK